MSGNGTSIPVPSPRQLAWHAMEVYGFVHFTVNTFTDLEWGYGDEDPAIFDPKEFDADQIAESARDGGLKGLILTCKHHDGFCLWPSALTGHSVKSSPWRNGRGDAVRELSDACARAGLRFGTYLSPWDRNHPQYARPAYIDYYRGQLRELLTGYGPLFEVWFDGANGGDGFYGGARETRRIDKTTYYDWDNTWDIVRKLQPEACLFSDAGPDIRWVGNEKGIAGDPCWATMDLDGIIPGDADQAVLNAGVRNGAKWLPAECDVSIRPGWFYHAAEDDRVKSPVELVDLFFKSVGRGASFLLNLPPDKRGLIHENDRASLRGFKRFIDRTFSENLADRASETTFILDGEEIPAPGPGSIHGPEALPLDIVLDFGKPVRFDIAEIREDISRGQRVDGFEVAVREPAGWRTVTKGQSVGARRLARFDSTEAKQVRFRITEASAFPIVSEIGLYRSV